jgi:hypothetical protein
VGLTFPNGPNPVTVSDSDRRTEQAAHWNLLTCTWNALHMLESILLLNCLYTVLTSKFRSSLLQRQPTPPHTWSVWDPPLFWGYWGLKSGPILTRQVLYHLSHAYSLFCFRNFSNRVLLLCPSCPGPWFPYLKFPSSKDDRHVPSHLAFYWLKWGLANFLPWMASDPWSLPPEKLGLQVWAPAPGCTKLSSLSFVSSTAFVCNLQASSPPF